MMLWLDGWLNAPVPYSSVGSMNRFTIPYASTVSR